MSKVKNLMTQDLFENAPPDVKSAVMDSRGLIYLFECRKKHLAPNHRSWTVDAEAGEVGFYEYSGLYIPLDNPEGWQDSAIDRA